MNLTNAQRLTLKAFIAGNGTLNGHFTAGRYDELATALNVTASFWVWRSSLTEDEVVQTGGIDVANGNAATVFAWTGTGFITRSAGEQAAWARLFRNGVVDPTLDNVRQGFADILSGATAPAPANRNHLLVKAKRLATLAETQVIASGTGTFASPAKMGVFAINGNTIYAEGRVNPGDIGGIMA